MGREGIGVGSWNSGSLSLEPEEGAQVSSSMSCFFLGNWQLEFGDTVCFVEWGLWITRLDKVSHFIRGLRGLEQRFKLCRSVG